MTPWIAAIDPAFIAGRFGGDAFAASLGRARIYVEGPAVSGGRLVAVTSGNAEGTRLTTPLKLAVRIDGEMIDVGCACKKRGVCDHVLDVLVDVAIHPELRAALVTGATVAGLTAALPDLRTRTLEAQTLDERLAAWLPRRTFDDDLEIDVEVTVVGAEPRSALAVRFRRASSRALASAREVLEARLVPRRRRLVELLSPHHADKSALVATRGQASLLIELLREEIGLATEGFRARVRYAAEPVHPRVDPVGERLVARWAVGDEVVAESEAAFVFAGPFPWLYAAASRTFYRISPDVDLDMAIGLQRVPSLPADETVRERVGRALLVKGRGLGVRLPSPETFGLPPLEVPSFELRLTGSPLDVRAELLAVYQVGKIPVGDDREADGRDLEREEEARAIVEAAGLVRPDDGSPGFVAAEDRAVQLWQSLADLRARPEPRFEVVLTAALAKVKLGPPVTVDVRVGGEVGWLEAELDFRAGTLKVEIDRLHRALVDRSRWVALSDGTLAKIGEEVQALVSEAGAALGGRDKGFLPPHQFGRIARWIELADSVANAGVRIVVDETALRIRDRIRELAKERPEVVLPGGLELRPYQRTAVAWLELLRELGAGGLLADDMGLGKTVVTLAFVDRAKGEPRPTLVVCPTSVVGNWIAEAARFFPALRVLRWGADRTRTADLGAAFVEYDLVVTTYGVLRREIDRLAKVRFRVVVLDEAQNIKNPAAETSRAARRLDAETRIALTGTPIENRLSELWSLMTFANPGILGTAEDFDWRYEKPIAGRPDGAVAAELRSVVRPFILRRTKAEVLADLPPKTEIDRPCVLGLRQKRLYDALALAIRQAVAKNLETRKNARTHLSVLTGILRLRQMACDPRLVDREAPAADSAKRTAFLDLVRELVSEERRALVFSQFVELLQLWRQDLDEAKVAYEYLDGSTANRDAAVERFQKGTAPLFLISLKAGGAGLNLTEADTVIHCDPWWNPAVEDQATDRAHRIGQTKPVTVIRLFAKGTIEDKIALLKEEKEELAAAILDDAGARDPLAHGLGADELALLLGDADADPDVDREREPEP